MMMMQSLRGRGFPLSLHRTDPCRGMSGRVSTPLRSISLGHRRELPVAFGHGNGKKEVVAATVTKKFDPNSLTVTVCGCLVGGDQGGKAVGDRHSEMEPKGQEQDPRIARISSTIRVIPDFPKPGIMFQDITTLLLDPKAFKDTIDLFIERYKDKNISVVAGIEARGFIFGPPIALAIGAKFVPMRKPRKLPGEVISEEYSLEYGTDIMEMHVGAVEEGERALVVDDLIATG